MSRLTKFLWRIFIFGFTAFTLLIVAINFELLGDMPSMEEIENPASAMSSEVYAADGILLGNYYIQNRSNSEFNEISPNVFNALIATEDERFRDHSGIDGRATLRAVILAGKRGGGSTITQQLALNLFDERSSNTFIRIIQKLKEYILAVKLEKNLTKNEIITLYLNTVPFGDNVFGIKNASLTFFNKLPDKLSVDEAAVLIGMLKGNTIFNPRRNPERATNRRNTVIDQMQNSNFLTTGEAEKYKSKKLVLNYKKIDHHDGLAPYFRQVLEQEIKKWCKENKKPNGENYNIYKDGLQIYTTLDSKLQQYAEEAVAEHMKSLQGQFIEQSKIKSGSIWNEKKPKEALDNWIKRSDRYIAMKDAGHSEQEILEAFNKPVSMSIFSWKATNNIVDTIMTPLDSIKYIRAFLQAGFMVMDPHNGEVKAWVGGINHQFFQYDHVNIGTKRQVGSTIKPFLYCLAIDNGFTPCSSLSTAAQLFKGQKKPYNAGGTKAGSMSMDRALANSINNASLYLLNQVGINTFVDFLHDKCGISSNIEEVPSIALGVSDISLIEMLGGYSMFVNRGIRTEPNFIAKIEDKNGNVIYTSSPKQKEIINEDVAFRMVDMMQGVTQFGTGQRLRSRYGLSGDMAGKTGTTNNQADAWFIGFTPQLLAGAWVGCDDRFLRFSSTAQGQGAAAALPIWAYFFKRVYGDQSTGYTDKEKFIKPANYDKCGGGGFRPSGGGSYYGNDDDDSNLNDGTTDPSNNQSNQSGVKDQPAPKEEPQEVVIPIEEW